ncbi:sensor domain-containing diguanylate cyclase [Roseateles koreensis]|uniref:Sensor domain-containing diguanylate cyclase n=1 Tax=Roseateles koreensis TaxID=2987526 RepID=A0ABT5KRU8_9BURK|nr:sensor domain-containing diguanylate cyclase [Roseateles koreensis]MDC8785566.1 sensor domain-containing diguanylate cyclase [Roseateles koreensis]
MKLGIAFKLALLLMWVAVLAAGLSGYYAYQSSRALLVDSAKLELLTSTRVLARRISLNRDEIARNLQVLSSHPATVASLRAASQNDDVRVQAQTQLATLFQEMMRANPAYFQMRLIAAADHGQELVRVDRQGEQLLRIDRDDLQEKGHYSYVADSLKLPAGSLYQSRIAINHESGHHAGLNQPTLQLAMPVHFARSAAAAGVVVVNVDLKGMFDLLAADLPPSFRLYLANESGDVLIHPNIDKTFGFDRGRRVLIQDEFTDTAALVAGRQDHVLTQWDAESNEESGSGENNEKGKENESLVVAFIRPAIAAASSEKFLLLGLAQPLGDVLSRTQPVRHAIIQIVLSLSAAFGLLAVFVARALTRPINAITEEARRFSSGHAIGPLPTHRQDEIGGLARNFQALQTQLAQQMSELQLRQQELAHLSQCDILTGLPNRRLLEQQLDKACAYAKRYGGGVCVLFIDLDKFKAVNDQYGHDAGDVMLKAVAERLLSMVREGDTVARLGGDEFVVLLGANANTEAVMTIAEKLIVGLTQPVQFEGHALQIGASIGIARSPQDGQYRTELMAKADKAMYEAKALGTSGFRFASSPDSAGTPATTAVTTSTAPPEPLSR